MVSILTFLISGECEAYFESLCPPHDHTGDDPEYSDGDTMRSSKVGQSTIIPTLRHDHIPVISTQALLEPKVATESGKEGEDRRLTSTEKYSEGRKTRNHRTQSNTIQG